MKKTFILLFGLFLSLGVFAQNFTVTFEGNPVNNGDELIVNHEALDSDAEAALTITNVSNPIQAKVEVIENSQEHYFAVCTNDQCYLPFKTGEWTSPEFNGGELQVHLTPAGKASTDLIKVTIIDPSGDDLTFNIKWNIGVTAVNDIAFESNYSNIYPNPCQEVAKIDYNLPSNTQNSKVVVYNLIGNKVKEQKIIDKKGTVQFSTSDMNPGVYFYSFIVNNEAQTTHKFVVEK